MRIAIYAVVALGLLTAACGSNEEQRSSTGALTGAGAGALIGGPIGAAVGFGVGAVGGSAMPEGADTVAANALHKERSASRGVLERAGLSSSQGQPSEVVKQAQSQLQREGLYDGKIDGITGPQTRQAISAYQQREGLRQTATLDRDTLNRMNLSPATAGNAPNEASGSSAPNAQPNADMGNSTSTDTSANPNR
jgi:peptidoglycan hydrolase-like protein with peptidoglycan-binding domain